tara:strand:- start:142 stop:531 length:390 start_codon:yes stop_codon:yes gene_type:complete
MVNASLNWASFQGILCVLWGIPAGILGFMQLFFVLQRRADTSPAVIAKTVFIIIQSFGRMLMLPLAGFLLFFQGWRLDPILQFLTLLLVLGVIFESSTGIISDYQKWRFRTGRASANIPVQKQPTDLID